MGQSVGGAGDSAAGTGGRPGQVGQEDDLDRWDRRMTLTGGTGRGRQHSIQNPGENFSG